MKDLLLSAVHATLKGGAKILHVYEHEFDVEYKEDESPLTEADKQAHLAIVDVLDPTGIPVLSEEGKTIAFETRSNWETLWVVDPLDGTKEFVKRNGEFTVNIALVKDQAPQMGVIYVPVNETLYFGGIGLGAFKKTVKPTESFDSYESLLENAVKLPETQERKYTMVGSRSHMSDETATYFDQVKQRHPDAEVISRGSSLKICMVAEGSADVYPRFAPTMEWDTAAGHAIAIGAGFQMTNPENEQPLQYNKENLLNPWFIVK